MFIHLPWHIQEEILRYLSPWDLLSLAEAHPRLQRIVKDLHKDYRIIKRDKDLITSKIRIEIERNGRIEYYERIYTHDLQKARIHLVDDFLNQNVHLCRNFEKTNEKLDRDFEILLSNAHVQQINELEPRGLERQRFYTDHLLNPNIRNLDQLIQILAKTRASELSLLRSDYETILIPTEIQRFFDDSRVQRLNCLNLTFRPDYFKYLQKLRAGRLFLKIYLENHMDKVQRGFFEIERFYERKIQKWLDFKISLDCLHIQLNYDSPRDRGIRNALRKELLKMALRLSKDHQNALLDRELGDKIHLLRRKDGRGLLIYVDDLSISLITCDYEFRRKRGLNLDQVVREDLESISQLMMRIYRYELENLNGYPFESIQDREIRLFSILECQRRLVVECRKFMKSIDGVPERELAIDSMWYSERFDFCPFVVGPLLKDPIERQWPNHPLWDQHLRSAADFAKAFSKTGSMNDLLEFIPY